MTVKYVHGARIDQPLAVDDGTALSYLHADALGSIVKSTNAAGAVTLTRQYDAWGNLETSASEPGYSYTGREWDPETGLYYYRARYYDPKIGRFISEDPIRFLGGVNFYGYVRGNPVNYFDPTGLDWVYAQSTGSMVQVNNQTGAVTNTMTGYAGSPAGLNNPAMQYQTNVGPLPQGTYEIGPQQTNVTGTGTSLPASMRLFPDPNNYMGNPPRGGFLIHGGNMQTQTSSTGCIVLSPANRNTIGNSGDNVLIVLAVPLLPTRPIQGMVTLP